MGKETGAESPQQSERYPTCHGKISAGIGTLSSKREAGAADIPKF